MKEIVKIILVDDHQLFRSGIVAILNNALHTNVVGEVSDGHSVLALLKKTQTDVVILDLNMPGLSGLETCNKIIKAYPGTNILILSWHCESEQVFKLLEAGAKGFLSKDTTKDELLTAINAINQGASYFSQDISEMVLNFNSKSDEHLKSREVKLKITDREQEVLECIANEYTNKEIANRLFISQRTVETHRRNLIQKLQVKNTVGLVKYYFKSLKYGAYV